MYKQIADNYDLLTEAERRILEYILQNKSFVLKMTSESIAKKCNVSKTVLINMTQKLGFEGFSDFKFNLKNQFSDEKSDIGNFKNRDSIIDSVEKTLQINSEETLDKVSEMILKSSCIYVLARGTSKPIASYLGHILLTMNMKCIVIPDYNLLKIIAHSMNKDELLIAISLSGDTPIIVETAKIVKIHGNQLISLTSFSNNELAKYSDLNVFGACDDSNTKNFDTISRIPLFIAVELIINHLKLKQTLLK